MNATRERFGHPPLDPKLIFSYVGNGIPMLVRRAMGSDVSEELIRDAVAYFRVFYEEHATDRTQFYPGVRETVHELSANHTLAILTNKPERISREIIAFLGSEDYFTQIYGGDSFAARKPDPAGINMLISELAIQREHTLMIGDSAVDIRTARNASVRSCGVAWGFQPDTFEADPPDLLIQHPGELLAVLKAPAAERI